VDKIYTLREGRGAQPFTPAAASSGKLKSIP
jgi:hypothetical protein